MKFFFLNNGAYNGIRIIFNSLYMGRCVLLLVLFLEPVNTKERRKKCGGWGGGGAGGICIRWDSKNIHITENGTFFNLCKMSLTTISAINLKNFF